jgi:glycosyltransferase involved in cell wall biosynthesis
MSEAVHDETRGSRGEVDAGAGAAHGDGFAPAIRVTIVQPSLAKYRIPVFRELASRRGIQLRVEYAALTGIPNVEADGFVAVPTGLRRLNVAGQGAMFQPAHWTSASRRHTDVLVMQWSPRMLSVLPGLLRARVSGVATVLWGHGYSKSERWWWASARNWLGRRANAVVFYEPRTRDEYIRRGWDPRKLFVALNSIDHAEIDEARRWWQARPDELAEFRRENDLDRGPVILFVSRHHAANRVDLLIQATAELSREIPGLKTVIIGNGQEEKDRLQSLACEMGTADSVVFLDGIYEEQRLAPWFLAADVFCYPSNMGLSLIHAFWYGLPVVTGDNMTLHGPEVVALEHGVNGLACEHGSAPALTSALRRVVTDKALGAEMSRAARNTVESKFTVERMADGLEAAIRYAHDRARRHRHT